MSDAEFNSDATKWGSTELCPGQEFKIPNVIMCVWYGDVGEAGERLTFDRYVQHFKRLGFNLDVFKSRYKALVVDAARHQTEFKIIQGLFVIGHGNTDGFGTGNGFWDRNRSREWITYLELEKALKYKLGAVILWVCYGGGTNARSLSSQSGECVFNGVDRTLYPIIDYPSIFDLFEKGKQGTEKP